MANKERAYSVWVGGTEVNDHLLTLKSAEIMAQKWVDDGYDDVYVERYEEDNNG